MLAAMRLHSLSSTKYLLAHVMAFEARQSTTRHLHASSASGDVRRLRLAAHMHITFASCRSRHTTTADDR